MWAKAAITGLLVALAAAPLHAQVQWLTDLDEAIQRATSERKVIVAEVGRGFDKFLSDAEKHPVLVREYASFVLVRYNPRLNSPAVKSLSAEHINGSIVALDPRGVYVAAFDEVSLDAFTQFLVGLRKEAPIILATADLRAQGNDPQADLALGSVAFRMEDKVHAHGLITRAQARWKELGQPERAQFAEISATFITYFLRLDENARKAAIDRLRLLAGHALTPANRANADFSLGVLFADPNRTYVSGTDDPNIYFQRAYEAAPPESPIRETARKALIERGVPPKETRKGDATIAIVAPARSTITGRAQFSVAASPRVARVAWYIDGLAVASVKKAPFAAALQLGFIPRLHTIRAVAYDAEGRQFAEASMSVNDRLDAFRVAIVSPSSETASGRVSFEADPQIPPKRKLEKVDLYRGDEHIAELTEPPFRAEVDLSNEFTFLRAVATLDDGRTAEETRVINAGSTYGETVDIHSVTFPAMVEDRDGKRVEGLTPKDLVIRDDGAPIAFTLRDAKDEPATIGLAIDASASMGDSLLSTLEAAHAFVDAVVSKQENVFLMTFDDRPHLVHDATSDAAALHTALTSIRPLGSTAVFDAITFGLQQFTGLGGKKALVIMTDGLDVISSQTATTAMRMAQESGVPVYVVVPHSARNQAMFAAGLKNIATATGGLFVDRPTSEQATPIFMQIRDDVRGQYLISFVSSAKAAGAWHALKVELRGHDGVVRTIGGYAAR
jgi:VWFA-related protein